MIQLTNINFCLLEIFEAFIFAQARWVSTAGIEMFSWRGPSYGTGDYSAPARGPVTPVHRAASVAWCLQMIPAPSPSPSMRNSTRHLVSAFNTNLEKIPTQRMHPFIYLLNCPQDIYLVSLHLNSNLHDAMKPRFKMIGDCLPLYW